MWEAVLKGLTTAAVAYTTHYGVTKLYNEFCVPDGFWGFLQGAVTTGSPVCSAGVQLIQNTQVSYSTVVLMGLTRFVVDLVAPGSGTAVGTAAAATCAAAAGVSC